MYDHTARRSPNRPLAGLHRPRTPNRYLHGHGHVVLVPARIAAWLDTKGLSALRINARGVDAEVDEVLSALHLAALSWRTSVQAEATAAVAVADGTETEPLMVSTTEAAVVLGLSPRGVRLALAEGRLSGQQDGGRWRIAREDLEHFRAARTAA